MAPYRPAADVVKQNDKKKPIQLKRNATGDRREKNQRKENCHGPSTRKCYFFYSMTQVFIKSKTFVGSEVVKLAGTYSAPPPLLVYWYLHPMKYLTDFENMPNFI